MEKRTRHDGGGGFYSCRELKKRYEGMEEKKKKQNGLNSSPAAEMYSVSPTQCTYKAGEP